MDARFAMRMAMLLLGCVFAGPVAAHPEKTQAANLDAKGWPVDAFALTDQHGRPFTQSRLQGQWTFVLLGDTQCGPPCAAALSALAGLARRIAPARAAATTQVLFVSMDPQRDTAQRLQAYLAAYPPGFIAATGSPATLQHLAEDLGLAGGALRGEAGTRPGYPGSLVLVGPDGLVRAEYLPPFDVPLLTATYLKTRVRSE
jgi:protein SCO1